MRVVVIGGTGLIGAQLVAELRARGHDVLAASPATGVDAVTGDGLERAVASADVVVDVSNSPSFDAAAVLAFFEGSARNLAAASLAARVGHLVALSVVGTDRLLESAYFRAKMAQEDVIRSSAAPYTIVRATQFYEFADGIAQAGSDGDVVRLPAGLVQPVASADVVAALARVVADPPARDTIEVAGPERMPLAEFVRRSLAARGDRRRVTVDGGARYFGARLRDETLTPGPGARLGATRLEAWLAGRGSAASPPTISVRRLTGADVDLAMRTLRLVASVFGEAAVAPSREYVAGLLARPDFWLLAALRGDVPVGGLTAHLLPMTRSESSELFIYDLAVDPAHQRRGIGRALVDALRRQAHEAGIGVAFVAADDEDRHALDFYRALGGEASPVTIFTLDPGRR